MVESEVVCGRLTYVCQPHQCAFYYMCTHTYKVATYRRCELGLTPAKLFSKNLSSSRTNEASFWARRCPALRRS